jgi:hypothetical protein
MLPADQITRGAMPCAVKSTKHRCPLHKQRAPSLSNVSSTHKLAIWVETSEISVFQIMVGRFLPADIYNTDYWVGMQGKFKIFLAANCCKKISRWSLAGREFTIDYQYCSGFCWGKNFLYFTHFNLRPPSDYV